jgi:hypothetical protein
MVLFRGPIASVYGKPTMLFDRDAPRPRRTAYGTLRRKQNVLSRDQADAERIPFGTRMELALMPLKPFNQRDCLQSGAMSAAAHPGTP